MKKIICLSLIVLFWSLYIIKADEIIINTQNEYDNLYNKISLLESNIEEKIRELESKDESISQLENIIREKSDAISSLQNDIKAHREKGSVGDKEQRDQARISELETQVAKLKKEIEKLSKKRDALESRASTAEQKVTDLNLKLESLKRINDEQKTRIRKNERALRVAEEELLKAKSRETTFYKELKEAQQSWVPHWLSIHLLHCQSFISTQWKESGRPMLDATVEKALQKKAELHKWAEPHIETVTTKWLPAVKDQSSKLVSQVGPQIKLVTTKTSEIYHASKNSIGPHVIKLQEAVDPYFQEVKKFTKPYVDQVVTVSKPQVDKARVWLKPYTKKISRGYRKFLKALTPYHLQVQTAIREILRNNEFTKPLATGKVVWYAASGVMALPLLFLFNLVSPIRSKPKRRSRNSHTGHTRRKTKRVHVQN